YFLGFSTKALTLHNSALLNRAFLIQSRRRPKLETKQKYGGIRNSQPPPTLGYYCVDELKQCNVQGSVTTYRVWLLRALYPCRTNGERHRYDRLAMNELR
ncbi:hypothetical protein CSPX01_14949, partial [Colletotrichum filicis]